MCPRAGKVHYLWKHARPLRCFSPCRQPLELKQCPEDAMTPTDRFSQLTNLDHGEPPQQPLIELPRR